MYFNVFYFSLRVYPRDISLTLLHFLRVNERSEKMFFSRKHDGNDPTVRVLREAP